MRRGQRRRRDFELPSEGEKSRAVQTMFDRIAPRYDRLNRIMTFGLDIRWRRTALRVLGLPEGAAVVDVACGTGDFCRMLEAAGCRAVGMDFSWGMLERARTGVPLVQADALRMPLRSASLDGATCGFALRNVVDLAELFAELGRVVRPGGRIALLEVAEPESRVLRAGHHLYFRRIVPLVGGLLSDKEAYRYLPESTAYLPPPAEIHDLLESAGFSGVTRRLLGLGAVQLLTATRS